MLSDPLIRSQDNQHNWIRATALGSSPPRASSLDFGSHGLWQALGELTLSRRDEAVASTSTRFSRAVVAFISQAAPAARGVSDAHLQGIPHEKGGPPGLVRLVMECDRTIVY